MLTHITHLPPWERPDKFLTAIKVVNLYVSAKNRYQSQDYSALQGQFNMSTIHSKQPAPNAECSFTARGFKTVIQRIGSALNP